MRMRSDRCSFGRCTSPPRRAAMFGAQFECLYCWLSFAFA
jgi:hypothetical protein